MKNSHKSIRKRQKDKWAKVVKVYFTEEKEMNKYTWKLLNLIGT